jgi:hypothetical protein
VPLTLSFVLDNEDKDSATGHVYVEDGTEQNGEFYEIKAAKRVITFKQHNAGSINSATKNIEKLYLTGTN